MRNIESKFRCQDHEGIARRALDMGARDEGMLQQRDQFFRVPHGRLKLRTFNDGRSELIAYDRADRLEGRASDYAMHRTNAGSMLDEVLGRALPRTAILEKQRRLLIHKNTRIHLDDVTGLGRFVELETVLTTQSPADAEREHEDVVRSLELGEAERISVGYIDLRVPDDDRGGEGESADS